MFFYAAQRKPNKEILFLLLLHQRSRCRPKITYRPERTPVASCITNLSPPIQCIRCIKSPQRAQDPVLTKNNEKRTNYWLGKVSLFPLGLWGKGGYLA